MLGGDDNGMATALLAALGLVVVFGASATYITRKRSS
jgi:hypothetical protein